MVSFKKILFPTDFSANANHALTHAIQIANFQKGELIVQHVVSNYFEQYPHWATLFDVHELQKHMDNYVSAQMSKILPNDSIAVRRVISKGKPAEEIAALAEKEMADIVVMGSAKGSITEKVIRLTNRPVLAVSSHPSDHDDNPSYRVRQILVATDFSEHSKRVVQYAFDLKVMTGASIYMLYVIETPKALEFGLRQGHFTNPVEKMREWAANELINLTPDGFLNDPSTIRLVETGSPSDRIAEVANEVSADLTILGTHEYGTLHQHMLGSTTGKLLMKTSVPVLALKL